MLDDFEKEDAWTQIWKLKHAYPGLTAGERESLFTSFYDYLDYSRRTQAQAGGSKLPPGDSTNIPKPCGVTCDFNIHDPKHYSFGKKLLWIPWAKDAPSGTRRGVFARGYPAGAVLHWTAGWRDGLEDGNELMRNTGMLYLLGDKDGNVAQSDPLNYWGYHAGASRWQGFKGGLNDDFVGYELQAAGYLDPDSAGEWYYPWWDIDEETKRHRFDPKNRIPKSEVAVAQYSRGNIVEGAYHAYTEQQIASARMVFCWLHLNNPEVFSLNNVVGHDEISPGRKVDPGAAIRMPSGKIYTMEEFRNLLRQDVQQIQANR